MGPTIEQLEATGTSCDWGGCNKPSIGWREVGEEDWLPVCEDHLGIVQQLRAALDAERAKVRALEAEHEQLRQDAAQWERSAIAYSAALDAERAKVAHSSTIATYALALLCGGDIDRAKQYMAMESVDEVFAALDTAREG